MREQMNALQRKLVRVVTENEALRHVVDKLQCSVLLLRRQLQRAGMALDAEVDESLLRPSPHQVRRTAVVIQHMSQHVVMERRSAHVRGCPQVPV
jgi:hypothetical protein